MFVKVSPRWLIKASEIRAVGHYKDNDTELTVQYIDGDETNFGCETKAQRDKYLKEIEDTLCIHPGQSVIGADE